MMRYDQICYLQLRSQGIGINDIQSLGTALVNLTTLDLCIRIIIEVNAK